MGAAAEIIATIPPEVLSALSEDQAAELLRRTRALDDAEAKNKLLTFYSTPEVRAAYRPSMEFFEAGSKHRQRLLLAANRYGKTEGVGGFELSLHLTGRYPDWWQGRRFKRPIRAWAAGDTRETVRDILQVKLLGAHDRLGTGLIPADAIARVTRAPGVAESADTIYVRHARGGTSVLSFKSYDQGRRAFQGTEQDVVWLDEECPLDVLTECLIRTMTTRGILLCTFTPLLGMSETVLYFLESGDISRHGDVGGGRYIVTATWDDAPHLSAEDKAELWASIPPYQRDARSKGIPQLGSGAIYPVPETDFLIDDFRIPDHFARGFAMDVGWNRTAVLWGAYDRDKSVLYIIDEHYRGQSEPAIHRAAIEARGLWQPGVIDPAAAGRSQRDGEQLLAQYRKLGLRIEPALNSVEAGLLAVWQRLSAGQIKVFRSCTNFMREFRLYRRDDKGRVVKENDHLMDCLRYLVASGLDRMCLHPTLRAQQFATVNGRRSSLVAP